MASQAIVHITEGLSLPIKQRIEQVCVIRLRQMNQIIQVMLSLTLLGRE